MNSSETLYEALYRAAARVLPLAAPSQRYALERALETSDLVLARQLDREADAAAIAAPSRARISEAYAAWVVLCAVRRDMDGLRLAVRAWAAVGRAQEERDAQQRDLSEQPE